MKGILNPRLRRVTMKELRVLAAVVRAGTMSAAAELLSVTPPAITQQLRQLEEGLGVPLVERTGQGLRPTDAGREVLEATARIEAALFDCGEALDALRGMDGGRVAVGVISTAKYFAPRALAAFKRAHPRVEMRVLVGNRQEMLAALAGFDLDLAVIGRPPEGFEIDKAVIGDHPHVVIAPPGHPLVGRPGLTLAALGAEDFLLREAGSGTRLLVQQLFAEAGLSPAIGMEIGSNETIKQAVMAGMGIALLSAHTIAAEVHDGRLAILEVQGLPIMRQWFVAKRREKRLLPASQALWNHLAEAGSGFLPEIALTPSSTRSEAPAPPRR